MWKWLTDRLARRPDPLVEDDARALIERHGIQAYGVARWRCHQIDRGFLIDESRPDRHWHAVRLRIAKLTGHEIGLDNATRREMDN